MCLEETVGDRKVVMAVEGLKRRLGLGLGLEVVVAVEEDVVAVEGRKRSGWGQ